VIPEIVALSVLLLAGVAEWLHARRVRRVAHLAFGPAARPAGWVWAASVARTFSLALLTWGLLTLYRIEPKFAPPKPVSDPKAFRRILIALDVSPSMQLSDAGLEGKLTRAKRASDVVMSILDRVHLEQAKVTVVAFYTGAKPVVTDAADPNVVRNIMSDLPLEQAFDHGKTSILDGLKEAFEIAKPWREKSTTLLLVSDGDTVPATGMPPRPPSISEVVVIGVGDTRIGKFIDGHQSRQDAATLRQVAARLGGTYHDGNEKHLPSDVLAHLAEALPLRQEQKAGRRELAITAVSVGGTVLALVPIALALLGTAYRAGRQAVEAAPAVSSARPRRDRAPTRPQPTGAAYA
jgi:Ca-activated chloride channel family protein